MSKVKINCSYCGKEYEREKKYHNRAMNNNLPEYCSTRCRSFAMGTQILPCSNCGKEVKVQAARLKNSIHGNIFCSKSCAASFNNSNYRCGEKNPNHKGTYRGSYRLAAFANQEHKCAICGWDKDERVLQVHHIDEDRSNNDLTNLIILCPTCHCFLTLHLYTLKELRNLF